MTSALATIDGRRVLTIDRGEWLNGAVAGVLQIQGLREHYQPRRLDRHAPRRHAHRGQAGHLRGDL